MLEQRISDRPLPKGLDALWDRASGLVTGFVPRLRDCLQRAEQVLELETEYSVMNDSTLRETIVLLREKYRLGRDTSDDLIPA